MEISKIKDFKGDIPKFIIYKNTLDNAVISYADKLEKEEDIYYNIIPEDFFHKYVEDAKDVDDLIKTLGELIANSVVDTTKDFEFVYYINKR